MSVEKASLAGLWWSSSKPAASRVLAFMVTCNLNDWSHDRESQKSLSGTASHSVKYYTLHVLLYGTPSVLTAVHIP
jgi:hypothetical protein